MEKSFTPNCDPEYLEKLLENPHYKKIAAPCLVNYIMAYVRGTRPVESKVMGNLKLYLN